MKEYTWRYTKSVFNSLERDTRRNEALEQLLGTGPRAVYAGLLMYAQARHYDPGWAAHCFKEIYGSWPQGSDRHVKPEALPNYLIEKWAVTRKRKPTRLTNGPP
jgi:hypothetical protein